MINNNLYIERTAKKSWDFSLAVLEFEKSLIYDETKDVRKIKRGGV